MSRRKKTAVIVLSVAAGVLILSTVGLRLLLSRDLLVSMLVPRLEKAVDAKITITDIGVQFPFGFGVDVDGLAFRKDIRGAGELDVRADKLEVKVSLLSLIRRRPEIKSVTARDASVSFTGLEEGPVLKITGVKAQLAMDPLEESYVITADIYAESVEAKGGDRPSPVTVADLRLSGTVESSADFDSLSIDDVSLSLGEALGAVVSGKLVDLSGERDFTIRLATGETDAAGLVAWAAAIDPSAAEKMPVSVESGVIDVDAELSGSLLRPAQTSVRGEVEIKGVTVSSGDLPQTVSISGKAGFTESTGEGSYELSSGGSSAAGTVGIRLGEGRKPENISLTCRADVDLASLPARDEGEGMPVKGMMNADIRAEGHPDIFKAIFPGKGQDATQESIARAWNDIDLKGKVRLTGVEVAGSEPHMSITALQADADLNGGNIENVRAGFRLGGRPVDVSGSIRRILPAASGLLLVMKDGGAPVTPAGILGAMKIVPSTDLNVEASVLDLRPFQKAEKEKKEAGGGAIREGTDAADSPAAGLAYILFIKNANASAGIDSIITDKALFTKASAKARIEDGVAVIAPLSLEYAGGKGKGSARIDLRDPSSIKTGFDVSFTEVESARALTPVHSMGKLLTGRFSFTTRGSMVSGEGIDPLMTFAADGSATSTQGIVNLSRFISPVSTLAGIDLSNLEKIDFSNWTGNFYINNGRLGTDDWKIKSVSGDWDIKGSFGFDGSLDYTARVVVPPSVQRKMKDLDRYRDLVDLFRDENGNLILDLGIGGTAGSPKISLDQTKAKQKAGDKLMDNLKKGAEDKLKEFFKKKKD